FGEGHGRGADEVVFELRHRRAFRGANRQRVFDDTIAQIGLPQLPAQALVVGYFDSLESDDQRVGRRLKLFAQHLDFLGFLCSGFHGYTPSIAIRNQNSAVFSLIPGPIVEEMVAFFTYLPLAAEGLARMTASIRLLVFSARICASKLTLPTGAWMTPVLSTRNSTLPALVSRTAFPTSAVTVPVLGFGIRPLGPRIFPSWPTARIISGVAISASKSSQPPLIRVTISSPPTSSAPASLASCSLSGVEAMTTTRLDLP